MTRRRLLRWSLILVILAAFAVWLEPTRVVWGWLRGEAFYQGKPTSWWAGELGRWDIHVMHAHMNMDGMKGCRIIVHHIREDSAFERLCKKLLRDETQREAPGALTGDPAAEAVLAELVNHPVEQVRLMARHGLARIDRLAAYVPQTAEPENGQP